MAKKLRCYLYTRVSTGIQVDGYSLEAQKERLEKEAIHRGMKVVGTYSDEGKSGKNVTGRPEFQRMLADIQSGKDEVDYVLVFKLSRFGRNAADTLNSLQFMEDYGVNLYCVEDNIDSAGAAGKLMISVVAAVAEIERENIHEQTMAGRRQKARDGRWNGGFAPYGYTLVPRDGERGKVLEINEKEAELVRIIFDKFANTDMGCNSVAKWLNDHGYTKEVRQNGTLSTISSNFVKLVLDNPVYMGKIAYGRRKTEKIEGKRNEYHVVKQAEDAYELYQGIHEAIVSEELWQKAHAKRLVTGVKYDKVHDTGHCHILSGLLRCPECGAKMYGVVNRKKKAGSDDFYKDMWYYKCKNRIKVEGHFCTYKTHIRQDIVNAEVISIVKYALNDEEFKRRIAQRAGGKEDGSLDELMAEKVRLEDTKKKLEIRKKKMLDKIGNMDVDDELYDTLFEDYMGVVRELTEKLAKLDADLLRNNIAIENMQKQTFTAEQYYELLDAIVRYMEEIPENRIKQLMGLVLDKVELFPKRQANGRWVRNVRFKVPLDVDGTFYDSIGFHGDGEEKGEGDDSVYFLPNEMHDETDDGNGNILEEEVQETITTLRIVVSHKTADEMAQEYGFNADQKEQLVALLDTENNSLWSNVLYGVYAADDQIVAVAASQLGNVGGQPYWSWYGFGSRVEWCACFVSWCANECGYIDVGVIPKFALCSWGAQWFKDRGQWGDNSMEPAPGTIIFFDWDGDRDPDHVGIVEYTENGVVHTIEGNSGDTCRQRQYSVGNGQIYGYGLPAY